jgi:hypothetical protein
VLAGIDPPRKWAAPVRLTDVIRAALGEVEDYQRVVLRDVPPATIQGTAAADMAHLLAEFVENALTFSPPDSEVVVHGAPQVDGRYTLTIADAGLGMTPSDIALANRRLAGAESFTVAPSKYLGHYVAANLALRHGVSVRLDSSPGVGITVTIDMPAALLTADEPLPAGVPLGSGASAVSVADLAGGTPMTAVPAAVGAALAAGAGTGDPAGGAPEGPAGFDVWQAAVGSPPIGPLERSAPDPHTSAGGPWAPPPSGVEAGPVGPGDPSVRHVARPAAAEIRRTAGGLPMRRPVAPTNRAAGASRARAQDDLLVALNRQGSGLARRVPGAQLPDTGMPNLRRGTGPTPPRPPAGAPDPAGDPAGQLHDLLSRFSDGLDRARDQSPPPPNTPGTPDDR